MTCQCTNLDERWRCDVCEHTWYGRLSDCPVCGAGVDEHVWIVKVASITKLTHTQQQYLLELEDGPKTTRELVMARGVSGAFVTRMMKRLREAGMVRSSRVLGARGNVWQHELIRSSEVIIP